MSLTGRHLNSRVQEVKRKTQSVLLLFGLAGVGAAMTHFAEGPLVALITLALVALAGASAVAHNFPVCSTAVVKRLAVAGRAPVSFVAQAFAAQAPAVPLGQNKISDHHRGFTDDCTYFLMHSTSHLRFVLPSKSQSCCHGRCYASQDFCS